jgi:hypothetical protein
VRRYRRLPAPPPHEHYPHLPRSSPPPPPRRTPACNRWATESNTIAGSFTYTAPQAPASVPAAYTAQAKTLTQQRVALGGYRLGLLLDSIFSGADGGAYARAVRAAFRADPRDAPEEEEEEQQQQAAAARPAKLRGGSAATA